MMTNVLIDLGHFIFFFMILLTLFSMIFAVIGAGNPNVPGEYHDYYDIVTGEYADEIEPPPLIGEEYDTVGLALGYFLSTVRVSLGDFDFDGSTYLNKWDNYLYWINWFLVVVMSCIVFLNFVIAEASNSYEKIKSRVDAVV